MVMGVNENRVLCALQPTASTSCNEMDTVRRGLKAMHELQDYVDAQAGGPGKGFFQIVTDPYEARRVDQPGPDGGRPGDRDLRAVRLRELETPTCDQAQVDRQLDEMYKLGVRSSLLLNKFDNPLTGVRFDSGIDRRRHQRRQQGQRRHLFWSAEDLQGAAADNTIETPSPQASAAFSGLLATVGIQSGTAPTYPPAPHCNTRGLTTLGKHVVNRMMDLHMIVNPDHMSQAGVDETLSLLEARNYSGVISPHGWMDPGNWPRLWKLGGMAFPGHSSAQSSTSTSTRSSGPKSTPYKFGWGYGADLGGLSHQPEPTRATARSRTRSRASTGRSPSSARRPATGPSTTRRRASPTTACTPDWFEDLRRLGGQSMVDDMLAGAESYLEMWERADGVPDTDLPPARRPDQDQRPRRPAHRRRLDRPAASPRASPSSARAPGAGA